MVGLPCRPARRRVQRGDARVPGRAHALRRRRHAAPGRPHARHRRRQRRPSVLAGAAVARGRHARRRSDARHAWLRRAVARAALGCGARAASAPWGSQGPLELCAAALRLSFQSCQGLIKAILWTRANCFSRASLYYDSWAPRLTGLVARAGEEGHDWALWQGVVVQLPGGALGVVQAAGADSLCTIAAAEAAPGGQLSVPPGARTFVQVRLPDREGSAWFCVRN